MSEQSTNAPLLTPEEMAQLRAHKLPVKSFGHVPNKSEALSRAKYEARKAAKTRQTNQ